MDNAIADTFDSLRPKLKLMTTLEEANAAVQELQKEYVEKLGECSDPKQNLMIINSVNC